VVQHPDHDDDFAEWLARHSLTCDDGRWLADRRDPAPLDWPAWSEHAEVDNWQWSLARSDFDAQLFRADGRVTVWGSWTRIRDYRAEAVSVRSALVTPERSRSLLAALQTTTDAHDYAIPGEDDERELSSSDYELRGWITTPDPSSGIDDRDPWSGKITHPGPAPAPYVVTLMALVTDSENRVWRRDGDPALVSRLWGEFPEKPGRDDVDQGGCLHACTDFLSSLLRATGKHLIVEVSIERRYTYGSYRSRSNKSDEVLEPLLPSVRLFLFGDDGRVRTI
jgi:hypothetical protein